MPDLLGGNLTGVFYFWRNGFLADPASGPTLDEVRLPDFSVLPSPPALVHQATGVYSLTIPGAANTQTGTVIATVHSDDLTLDAPVSQYQWQVVSSAESDPLLREVPGGYADGTAGWALGLLASISAKVQSLAGPLINLLSPVRSNLVVQIKYGDDYYYADGRALFADRAFDNAPSLIGGSVALKIKQSLTQMVVFPGVVVSASQCYVELSGAQTLTIPLVIPPSQTYLYELEATLANGHIITLAEGPFIIEEDIR
jgi:hypothetical protein